MRELEEGASLQMEREARLQMEGGVAWHLTPYDCCLTPCDH